MDTLSRLKSIPLFASLAPEDLARVAKIAPRRLYPKDSPLCHQGEFGETLYIIDSGEVILHQRDLRGLERPTGVLKAGQFFGEGALLLGSAYGSSVQALTLVEAISIRKAEFDLLLQERPGMKRQLRLPPLIKEQLRTRSLPGQDKDDPWLLRRRRHWFVFVRHLPLVFITSLLSFIVALGLYLLGIDIGLPLIILLSGVIPSVMALWFLIDWLNDFYLVTTQRVLHREKVILLYETWDEAPLDRIQDTRIVSKALGNLLGFGTLQIQTASVRGTMTWDHLPDPVGMKTVIDQQVGYLQSRLQQSSREEIRQQLLRQTGRSTVEDEAPTAPPPQEPRRKLGLVGRLLPSRPLLRLRYEEAAQITWRKHWLFLLKRVYLALPSFLLVSAAILYTGVSSVLARYRFSLLLASLVLWMAAVFWLWWEWEDWRNDVYILTDTKIIDVEKKPLFFAAESREAGLDKIQNVSSNMPGVLANIFNYGNVLIETAGPTGTFTFDGVGQPAEVQREIFRRVEQYKQAQQRRERQQRNAELSTWFNIYHEIDQEEKPPGA